MLYFHCVLSTAALPASSVPSNSSLALKHHSTSRCHLFKKNLFIYLLFLAASGLCCCPRAFSGCGEQGLLFVAVRGLLIVVASLVAEHGL